MDKQFDPRGLEQKWYARWDAAGNGRMGGCD